MSAPPPYIEKSIWRHDRLPYVENVVLFCLTCIFAIFMVLTGMSYQAVYYDRDIFHPPYHPDIRLSADLPLFTSCAAFGWSFFTAVPHCLTWHKSKYWWLILVIVRCTIAALLIASAVLQSHFMPSPLGTCDNDNVWPESADVPPGTPTAFYLMRPIRIKTGGVTRPVSACGFLLHIWRFEIALAVIMIICAAYEAFIYISFEKISKHNHFHLRKTAYIGRLLGPPLRYSIAYIQRRRVLKQKPTQGCSSPLTPSKEFTPIDSDSSSTDYEKGEWSGGSRQECMCFEKYKDFRCWSCAMVKMCESCRATTSRQSPQLTHDKCRIACSDCFYEHCCKAKDNYSWFNPLTCTEHVDWSKRTAEFDFNLCQGNCLNLDKTELFMLREALEKDRLAEPVLAVLDCAHCGVACRRGMTVNKMYWWCCPYCDRVCKDKIHTDK